MDFEFTMLTDPNGKPSATDKELYLQYFLDNPNSKFKIIVSKLSSHSELLRAYYFAEVVTKCKVGLNDLGYNLNKDQTHEFIKQYSPIMVEHIYFDGDMKSRIKSINEIDNKQFIQYIEDIKQFAIEHLDIMIKEPNTDI
tara:strand:- start:23862 stop:24281 length:420 start_codon:yes stop_codon:yes gene_type:complete